MEKSLFERFLFEAPGDDDDVPPDIAATQGGSNPPDMPDDAPPDMGTDDDLTSGGADDMEGPPPMGDDDFAGTDDPTQDQQPEEDPFAGDVDHDEDIGLDDKVSAIMNANLYQRFLTLLSNIANQQTMVKNNIDILYSVSPDSISIVKSLNNLDENIRLYLKNYFQDENYSKNLLFFNKCLNLLKLLNDSFDKAIRKGIKQVE